MNTNALCFEYERVMFIKCISHSDIISACTNALDIIKEHPSYKETLFVSMLNGSVPFEEDLSSLADWSMDIMRISYHSYEGTQSTGKFNIDIPIDPDRVNGRDVIIIEDIIDTGRTMEKVIADLKEAGASSVNIICLLDKVGKHPTFPILFSGFKIKDCFVIGYGMDYDGNFRDLDHIYATGITDWSQLMY